MVKEMMTEAQAKEAVTKCKGYFGSTLDEESENAVIRGFMAGLVEFNETNEKFTVYLRKPITLENGEVIDKLSIQEPTADQVRMAGRTQDPFGQAVDILGYVSGWPVGILNRLKMRDISLAGSVLAFFV